VDPISIHFGKQYNPSSFFAGGWSDPDDHHTWTVGTESVLILPKLATKNDLLLDLEIDPHKHTDLPFQRLTVVVNEVEVGALKIDRHSTYTFLIPATALIDKETFVLKFRHPDAARPIDFFDPKYKDERRLAISFFSINIEEISEEAGVVASRLREAPLLSALDRKLSHKKYTEYELKVILSNFVSLGNDCEFGLMQRRMASVDQFSLFRFSSVPLQGVTRGLECSFSDLNNPAELEMLTDDDPNHDYVGWQKSYGMLYHTTKFPADISPEELKRSELVRLTFLARKLLADMRGGKKILVFKSDQQVLCEQVARLVLAVRNWGNSPILWMDVANESNPPGSVGLLTDGVMKGFVDQFGVPPFHDISGHCWVQVCLNAWHLSQEVAG
jgi:hypothetical protein